ncbi:retrotransposon protein, putative, ty1-copia subclass [Tanacetum coccineum]
MDTSKRRTIPLQPNVDLSKSQGPCTPAEVKQMKGISYASAVGSIMYAVRCTRHDIAFSHNLTSRYQQNPGESYWTTVKIILKYLRNTKYMFLFYGGESTTNLSVTCYIDASWETDRDDLRSQTGFVFMMNGGVVDWKSSKQSTTVMSSMKAEYIAVAKATMEAIWIRKFIYGLGVVPNIDKCMDMYYDNTGAIIVADEPGVQKGAKHFQRKYHFIQEAIQEGDILILKVHTDNNLADPFTKPMSCTKHVEHARSIRLRPHLQEVQEVNMIVEEEEDNWMTPIIKCLEEGVWPTEENEARTLQMKISQYVMEEGVLFKKSYLALMLRCVGPLQANYIIREVHEGACGMHAGSRSVIAKIMRQGYYWPTMHRDAKEELNKCDSCQIHALVPRLPNTRLTSIMSPWPFYQWGLDIMRPLSEGPSKLKFIIVAIDYFTKWMEAKPLAKTTCKEVKKFVWENIMVWTSESDRVR